MRSVVFVLLIACSGSSKPADPTPAQPAEPAPAPGEPAVMTKEECEAQGGRVHASIGGGAEPHCADDEAELAPVRIGIEGGWCCKKK